MVFVQSGQYLNNKAMETVISNLNRDLLLISALTMCWVLEEPLYITYLFHARRH